MDHLLAAARGKPRRTVIVDTSVLGAYYCPEPLSEKAEDTLRKIPGPVISSLSDVEFCSLISRKRQQKELGERQANEVLVRATTIDTSDQLARVLYEMTKERGSWPQFQVVDVAVQGLRQSEDKLRHAARSPLKAFRIARRTAGAKFDKFSIHFSTGFFCYGLVYLGARESGRTLFASIDGLR